MRKEIGMSGREKRIKGKRNILKQEKMLKAFFSEKEVTNSDEWIFGIWL